MDRPCKFADKGCKEVGDQAQMQAHMKNCNYGKSIEERLKSMESRVDILKMKQKEADLLTEQIANHLGVNLPKRPQPLYE